MEDWALENPADVTSYLWFESSMEVKAKAEDLLRENRDHIEKSRFRPPKLNEPVPSLPIITENSTFTLCLHHTKKLSEIIKKAGCARF